jgi:hypothetical protein
MSDASSHVFYFGNEINTVWAVTFTAMTASKGADHPPHPTHHPTHHPTPHPTEEHLIVGKFSDDKGGYYTAKKRCSSRAEMDKTLAALKELFPETIEAEVV